MAREGGGAGRPARPERVLTATAPDLHLVMHHEPHGIQAEQYRAFRTNLAALNPTSASRTLAFASSHPSEGKSVSVANIAMCLAEANKADVCLIDADVRVPSLHTMLGVEMGVGLTDVLLDRVAPEQALRRLDIPHLTFLSAGRETDRAPQVMSSGYLPELVGYLKQRFQYILFDTPPCIAFADAAMLSEVIDGVVFVIAVGKTPRREVDVALQKLAAGGANVIGSFVTGIRTFETEIVYAADRQDEHAP